MSKLQLAPLALAALAGAAPLGGAAPPPALFSGDRAWGHLEAQLAMGPRVPGGPGHARARAYLRRELGKVARAVVADDFEGDLDGKPVRLTNLQADLGPTGPRPVLLAAHWDTRPWGERDPDPARRDDPIPGANDGASGVAVVLEAARVMRPRIPVRLVLFDGEDLGRELDGFFQGSRRFASRLGAARPRWGILVDMVGDRDLEIPREQFSRQEAPDVVRRVWAAARAAGYGAVFVDRDGPSIFDDHWPLIQAGVPMADLIDFDYPYWHTSGDTAERCSPRSLEAVGRTVVAALEAATP